MLSDTTRARLREELRRLDTELLPAAHAAIEDARTQGDTSQNPDFFLAAEAEGQLYARRSAVLAALGDAGSEEAFDGTVRPGVSVVLDFGEGEETFLFGSVEEMRSGFQVITPGSPLGAALSGQQAGTTVQHGSMSVRVVAVTPA